MHIQRVTHDNMRNCMHKSKRKSLTTNNMWRDYECYDARFGTSGTDGTAIAPGAPWFGLMNS
eukprot:5059316-Amphidinium_carterae.1